MVLPHRNIQKPSNAAMIRLYVMLVSLNVILMPSNVTKKKAPIECDSEWSYVILVVPNVTLTPFDVSKT